MSECDWISESLNEWISAWLSEEKNYNPFIINCFLPIMMMNKKKNEWLDF